jgi:hypothetical protein
MPAYVLSNVVVLALIALGIWAARYVVRRPIWRAGLRELWRLAFRQTRQPISQFLFANVKIHSGSNFELSKSRFCRLLKY